MTQFEGIWHVVQGTLTGSPVECITFNVTQKDSNRFNLTQLPHNLSSELVVADDAIPSKMNIKVNASSDANFYVLATDYGKHRPHVSRLATYLILLLHSLQTILLGFSSAKTTSMGIFNGRRRFCRERKVCLRKTTVT